MSVDVTTDTVIRRPVDAVAAELMAPAMRRANRKDLAALKQLLEQPS